MIKPPSNNTPPKIKKNTVADGAHISGHAQIMFFHFIVRALWLET
jgi:hypothetical protein